MSAAYNLQPLLTNLSIEANRMEPDQTAPTKAANQTLFVVIGILRVSLLNKLDSI